jgi:hypothetical protein
MPRSDPVAATRRTRFGVVSGLGVVVVNSGSSVR